MYFFFFLFVLFLFLEQFLAVLHGRATLRLRVILAKKKEKKGAVLTVFDRTGICLEPPHRNSIIRCQSAGTMQIKVTHASLSLLFGHFFSALSRSGLPQRRAKKFANVKYFETSLSNEAKLYRKATESKAMTS